MNSCVCCDNLAGFHATMMLHDIGVIYLCPGCATPRHRHMRAEQQEAEHMDPNWVASRMTFAEANAYVSVGE